MIAQGCVMISLDGLELLPQEKTLLQHPKTAGVVLFASNYQHPEQLKQLTDAIYQLRPNAFIGVDQEGGRVQRFIEGFTRLPAMRHWGKLYQQDPVRAKDQFRDILLVMIAELKQVGVNINLIPVLDVDSGISEVIGDRSFHSDVNIIVDLAELVVDTLHFEKMPAIGKHFPGHGSVSVDSHLGLPVDERGWDSLLVKDLQPFIRLLHKLDAVMPAHIVFPKMDDKPAGFSNFWLQKVLREELGFQGVIVSDDLTMEGAAFAGTYLERVQAALKVGCDLLLVGNHRAGNHTMQLEVLQSLESYSSKESEARLAKLLP